jgi:hypothetical protein
MLALPRWGFSHLGRQTERERIPNPRKKCRFNDEPVSPLALGKFLTLVSYADAALKVPFHGDCDHTFLDAGRAFPVAGKTPAKSLLEKEQQVYVLWEIRPEKK